MASVKKRTWIAVGAVLLALLVAAAVVVGVIRGKKAYTPVSAIDLQEYKLVDVEYERDFYCNEPEPRAALVFRNEEGKEKRAPLSEAQVTGLDTHEVGERVMSVSVEGQQLEVVYKVVYKDIYFNQSSAICLSLHDAFELKNLYASCTDYADTVVARIPLSEIFSENDVDVSEISETAQTAKTQYEGFSFTLSYTVGYIGYRNLYCSTASVKEGDRSFRVDRLRFFCKEEDKQPTRSAALSGYGSFYLVTEGDPDIYGDPLTFDWVADPANPARINLYLNRVADNADGSGACVYDANAHTLKVSSSVLSTANDLIFRLQLDSLPVSE